MPTTNTVLITKEEEQAAKRREQQRLASLRYRLRNKAKCNAKARERQAALKPDEEDIVRLRSARKKTAASYYKRNQETIRRKAIDKHIRSYVKNNGINSYDASYIPRRTKEAVALSKKEGRAQKSDVPAKDSKGSEPMSYPDLVKSIAASMKAQRQRKQTEQPI